ncbi:MAG: phosphoserine phosphatase SerB [Rhodospirillaceae bacterium]|nr:phosphoserine phosphatase SerB [Rhodospirillaceae bacterium]
MQSVLTLVADAGRRPLEAGLLADVAAAVARSGATVGAPLWLAEARACDLPVTGMAPEAVQDAAAAALADAPVDLFAQATGEGRRKRVLLADMDATMVPLETLDEMAAEAGLAERVVPITRRAMAGELDFMQALAERLALFAGLPASLLDTVLARTTLSPGAAVAVRTMRAHGAFCQLVSGGFTQFTDHVVVAAGFDAAESNVLEVADGKLSGRVLGPIVTKDRKLALLRELCTRLDVAAADVLAVGDGANDLPMLTAAGLGVAYRGKPAVRAACRARIDHTDLDTLLFFQGYREAEFWQG